MGFVTREIKFGVALHILHWPSRSHPFYKELDYNIIREIASEAEELRYHSVWGPDHIMQYKKEFELWTTFSFLASVTQKIRFHPGVLCNTFRRPSLLAKMAATFDVISGGRLDFGIGAGWHVKEHNAYGIPLPKPKNRIEMLEEAMTVIKSMWTKDKTSFQGKYYTVKDAVCEPKPLQKPHPPITIGGGGEKYTLRAVAKLADRCNLMKTLNPTARRLVAEGRLATYNGRFDPLLTPQEYKDKLEVLKRHCRDVNRDFNDIEKTIFTHVVIARREREVEEKLVAFTPKNYPVKEFTARRIVGTPEECVQKVKSYVDEAGITYFQLGFMDLPKRESMNLFAEEVMPAFQNK